MTKSANTFYILPPMWWITILKFLDFIQKVLYL